MQDGEKCACRLLEAMHNAGVEFYLNSALSELIERGEMMPGATCGKWGICGSASSVGAALAIIHATGPLSGNEYYKDNLHLTSGVLGRIAELGGPRCCKRNGLTAIDTAVNFVADRYGIILEKTPFVCQFSEKNQQCIGQRCPFHKEK